MKIKVKPIKKIIGGLWIDDNVDDGKYFNYNFTITCLEKYSSDDLDKRILNMCQHAIRAYRRQIK